MKDVGRMIGKLVPIALGVLLSLQVAAQPRGEGKPDPEKRLERLTEALSLTTDQQAEIRKVDAKFHESMKAMRESGKDREAMRPEAEKMRKEYDTDYKEILTAEQYEKFEELRKKRSKGERPQGQRPQGPPPR